MPLDLEAMLAGLAASADPIDGIDLERLRAAMNEPGARDAILRLYPRETTSVQRGEPARDFTLPFLAPGQGGETVTLSAHFGRQPVGLIFGSYT